jgi:hypothetical protein
MRKFILICDACKTEIISEHNAVKPPAWSELVIKSRPYKEDEADFVTHILLCHSCTLKIPAFNEAPKTLDVKKTVYKNAKH